MGRLRKKLLVMTGLFISGINSSWANNITIIRSESNQIKPINKYLNQANQKVFFELNSPKDLSLPSYSREVLVTTYKRINLEQLDKILLKNNPKIKVDVPKESIKEKEPEIVEYSDNEVKFFGFFFWLSSAALLILIVLVGLSLSY